MVSEYKNTLLHFQYDGTNDIINLINTRMNRLIWLMETQKQNHAIRVFLNLYSTYFCSQMKIL